MKLLSKGSSNAKLAKNSDASYEDYILYMMPSKKICPFATGCMKVCLQSAGMGAMPSVKAARLARRELFENDRGAFYSKLTMEVNDGLRKASRKGKKLAVRLNGTSDIDHGAFMERFPSVQFYDYTKDFVKARDNKLANYSVTFSRTEHNESQCSFLLRNNLCNVSVVFRDKLPATYLGFPVVDGTKGDQRYLDQKGVIIGLIALGKAKSDSSGFVVDV